MISKDKLYKWFFMTNSFNYFWFLKRTISFYLFIVLRD